VWLEITNLIVPSWTDEMSIIKEMCTWLVDNGFKDYPLHFSRFHPQYQLENLPATPVSVLNNAREIALNSGLNFVYIGNVPGTAAENTYCPGCKNIIIERKGFRIINNNLEKDNCKFCKTQINGIWN
ncbi:MAG: radical SAM protein, partial [Bacteroidales bacterium]|nr:radical SAM protein [Bacteroidales bacterium]